MGHPQFSDTYQGFGELANQDVGRDIILEARAPFP